MPNVPVATIVPAEQEVVVGSIAKLDGRSSLDPNNVGLTYVWTFSQVPIGSQVELFGFTDLEADSSIVSFAPDITGTYKIRLVVSDGSNTSDPTESLLDVRVILVPHHQGFIPDAGFIWNYLSDFWNLVPDKKRFEAVWSSMIQVASSEMLKLYQYQYNRSIRDIQETIQKRWLHFAPSLDLDRGKTSFILSDETAGSLASTSVIDSRTGLSDSSQPTYSNIITIPKTEGDFTKTSFGSATATGRLLRLSHRTFTMARTSPTFESLVHDIDGSTSGIDVFSGSHFASSMIGATLRILGPSSPLVGDYIINSFTSSTQISISNPPIGVTWTGSSGIEYTVLPAIAQNTSLFADRLQVPAALEDQFWRMSSTLISSQYNFDEQGVSVGDLIEIEILRLDLQVLSTFFVQVTGVDRNRLSFAFNLTDLINGSAAGGLTSDIQITLAADLIVPGLSADINGNLIYTLQAAVVNSAVTSVRFKRTYFEKILTTSDEINVEAFSIVARPVRIIRNSKVAIDLTVASIPILQEYIKQPDIVKDGDQIFFVANDTRTQVPRAPYLLAENLDYIIDDESTLSGTCQVQQGDNQILVPLGDLVDRSIAEGDILEVTQGTTVETFDIRQVLAADLLKVSPLPTITSTAALFTIRRRVAGKFIRFIDGVFSKTAPAPDRLWSEVTYFDNQSSIESNFGILVGVHREDLERVNSGISYKSAVAGLMYALSRGPTISNLALSGHILLGFPFAQSAGVIQEINPEFRKRDDGSPLFGRILIEGRDKNNAPTGITNIYFYPQGRQIFDVLSGKWIPAVPDFSGLAINPKTGIEYTVRDAVTQFAPLSKGVKIQEYLATPDLFNSLIAQGNIASQLQKYHAFQIVVNSDIITSTDTDLVAQFLKKAKAHYVRLISSLHLSLEDFVDIQDILSFDRPISFFDSSDLGTPTALKFDEDDYDDAILSLDGIFYVRYLVGDDLVTTQGSSIVQTPSGGFVTERSINNESWDPPLVRVGDVLQITKGHNFGKYAVTAISDDTHVTLDLGTDVLETLTEQTFIVYRPLRNPIWMGKVVITTGNATVPVQETAGGPGGIGAAGVSVGDRLVFTHLSTLNPTVSARYTILSVSPGSSPTVVISSGPGESSGTYDAWVVRNGLMTSGEIEPPGSAGEVFYVSGTVADNHINFVDTGSHRNSWLNVALLQPGSVIVIDSIPYEVLQLEPGLRRVVVTQPLLANYTDKQVTIDLRPGRPIVPISIDFLDRLPSDYLVLELVSSVTTGDNIQSTGGSPTATLTVATFSDMGVVPGDYLQILEGSDSTRDVGYGAGIYPIESASGSVAILTVNLLATGTFRYGIIRKVPNEG